MIIYKIYTCNVIEYSILMYFCYISVLMMFALINEKVKYDQKVNCQNNSGESAQYAGCEGQHRCSFWLYKNLF